MSKEIDEKQYKAWFAIASKLDKISVLIHDCEAILMLELGIVEGKAFERIKDIIEAAGGQGYMFHPQIEWTGGDSMDGRNFIPTLPHIAKKG